MPNKGFNENGFTGLEAAIVLIAFVVVAAVFSYVILGAGFFTTQKAQETVYRGIEQSTSNLQLVGNVYGLNSTSYVGTDRTINEIRFTLSLAPGASSMDISKMSVVLSTPDTTPQFVDVSPAVGALNPGEQKDLTITNFTSISRSTKFTIELRPATGASLSITRTAPAAIEITNILY